MQAQPARKWGKSMSNVIIIGRGPAGISAALYTSRAGIKTTIIGRDGGALSKAGKIENYYGLEEPVSGHALISAGIAQAKRMGVEVVDGEVVGISFDSALIVQTKEQTYRADSVILATGSARSAPRIKGLGKYEGHGISYCAVCDAFFYRGKDVAVLGGGDYAVHEALELLPTSKSVTLLTNGTPADAEVPAGIEVCTKKVEAFAGGNVLEKVVFEDGTSLEIAGVFIAIGVAGSGDLAKKLGAQTQDTKIVVDENMATNVPGLFAAGDCTGGMLQVAKAVYEGAKAGTEAVKYIRKNAAFEEKSK